MTTTTQDTTIDGLSLHDYCQQFCSPYQMSLEEYIRIASVILSRKPCYILVYGLGKDSEMYIRLNEGGVTVFVETDIQWILYIKSQLPHANIVHHTFPTTVKMSLENECTSTYVRPAYIDFHPWDIIIVDAPFGGKDEGMGREFPIREAAERFGSASTKVDVFVHDVDRSLETMACDKFFTSPPKSTYDRTRHYTNEL